MPHAQAGGHAFLFLRRKLGFGDAAFFAFFNKGRERGIALRRMRRQRMLRRHRDIRRAHQRISAGGEHPQHAPALDVVRKSNPHTKAFADPVFLHQAHLLGPAGKLVQLAQ